MNFQGMLHDPLLLILVGLFVVVGISWLIQKFRK